MDHPWLTDGRYEQKDAEIAATCAALDQQVRSLSDGVAELTRMPVEREAARAKAQAVVEPRTQQLRALTVAFEAARDAAQGRLVALGMAPDTTATELDEAARATQEARGALMSRGRRLADAHGALVDAEQREREAADREQEARDAERRARGLDAEARVRLEELGVAAVGEAALEGALLEAREGRRAGGRRGEVGAEQDGVRAQARSRTEAAGCHRRASS